MDSAVLPLGVDQDDGHPLLLRLGDEAGHRRGFAAARRAQDAEVTREDGLAVRRHRDRQVFEALGQTEAQIAA